MGAYDLVIVGGGCAGYPAGVYASRFNLKTLIIAKERGGLITTTHLVENFPGFRAISGPNLAKSFEEQAIAHGVEILDDIVSEVKKKGKVFVVKTSISEQVFEAKAVILATGSNHKHLGIESEEKFAGRGVSYCATCDSMFFKNKPVAIIGGGDSAVKEAMVLAQNCSKVYMIVRSKIRAEPANVEQISNNPKVEILLGTQVKEILGEEKVNGVLLDNGKKLDVAGVFVSVGLVPQSELAVGLGVKLNERGEIIIDRESRTNVEGVYAAGDVTDSSWKQAIVSASEGSIAANSAHEFIAKHF